MAKRQSFQGAEKTDQGLKYNGFLLQPIVESCNGCERVKEFQGEWFCSTYPYPASKWRNGSCNFATHVKRDLGKSAQAKLNPIKASKRARGKK